MCKTSVTVAVTYLTVFVLCVAGRFVLAGETSTSDAADDGRVTAASASEPSAAIDHPLLPPGTTVDRIEWLAGLMHLDLSIPAAAGAWLLTPVEMQDLAHHFALPYQDEAGFAGVVARVRLGHDTAYRHLEEFVRYAAGATEHGNEPLADEAVSEASRRAFAAYQDDGQRGGPVSNATQQPAGALSGVVIYTSAGHGWMADNTEWYLQRPLLWDMNEDHGNLDQLNYFVHYLFNAGATVVPFRPVGYQTNEIVLDNDDPGVTYTGTWTNGTGSKYYENGTTNSGIRYQAVDASPTESATARFTPTIPQSGFYPVYGFALAGANRVTQVYRVKHEAGVTEITIDHRETGTGWIWLGEYYLSAGTGNYVEITNESAVAGAVIADAIRWGNGIGDIVRPGPGTVSGYPRNEECSRYWAHSELGNNAVGFSPSAIWDSSGSDQSDNISTASRWAREMNQVPVGGVLVDRWKRLYYEFHTNAFNGSARGCIALISASAPTTNQAAYAAYLADEIDADMLVLDSDFEHNWVDRAAATYTAEFGAISTTGNGNEFDATIIELAFHDNQQDAELLRDARVRSYMARSSVQGIIRFLSTLPGSQVPLAFPPDTPGGVRVEDNGGGDVALSWDAPQAGPAYGDAATGYVVYESTDGLAFGAAAVLGNVLTITFSGVPLGETRYYRVAATNTGGESMPTETVAVRRPNAGTATVLIVNGFDRLRRFQNPIHDIGSGTFERPLWRQINSFDYVIEFAQALEPLGTGFASCVNETVINLQITLGDYDIALWNLGTESTEDSTLSSGEQSKVTAFLDDGGGFFVSGADIGYDLIDQLNGVSFMQNALATGYVSNDAGTSDVTAAGSGILSDIGAFDFDYANGAPYNVYSPDRLTRLTGAVGILNYVGGSGGTAGVQYDSGVFRTVTFGFPFEAITSATTRADIMQRIIAYLSAAAGPLLFDFDNDGDVDLSDYGAFNFCLQGPNATYTPGHFCLELDGNEDLDVDLDDFGMFQAVFTG